MLMWTRYLVWRVTSSPARRARARQRAAAILALLVVLIAFVVPYIIMIAAAL